MAKQLEKRDEERDKGGEKGEKREKWFNMNQHTGGGITAVSAGTSPRRKYRTR